MSAACGIMSVVANISMRHQRGRSEIGRLYRERCCKNFNFEKQFDSSFIFLCSHTCSHSEVLSERQHNQCGDCSGPLCPSGRWVTHLPKHLAYDWVALAIYTKQPVLFMFFFFLEPGWSRGKDLVSMYAQSLWIYSKWVRERKRAALPRALGLSQKQKKHAHPKHQQADCSDKPFLAWQRLTVKTLFIFSY